MHPRIVGMAFVILLLTEIAGCIVASQTNFVALTPALWSGAAVGVVCALAYVGHVAYQRRHLHRYDGRMRTTIADTFAPGSKRTHVVLVLVMGSFGYIAASQTLGALLTRLLGEFGEKSFVVEELIWHGGRGGNCYQVKLAGVPTLGQVFDRLCFARAMPVGSTLTLIGHHSVLGHWYSAVRITPKAKSR